MHCKSQHVDAFVAVSDYYASVMKEKMKIPPEKVQSIYLGVDPSDYQNNDMSLKSRNIGFLSRMNYDNGLDILADAFIIMKKTGKYDDVKLLLTGGSTGDDSKFLGNMKRKLKKVKLLQDVGFCEDFECDGRRTFFNSISVMSVPVRKGEAFGMYLLEAMASGIPVVQPALGAFPEIIEVSGGGIIYEPNTPEKLAETIMNILDDKELLTMKSRNGYKGVLEHFNIWDQTEKLLAFYKKMIKI